MVCCAACSAGSDPAKDTDGPDAAVGDSSDLVVSGEASCASDPRVDAYVPNLDKEGKLGVLSFRLVRSEPAPPAKGDNTLTLLIVDADGAPVDGELTVGLTMPDHGHGSMLEPTVSYDADSGFRTVTPVNLFMAGVWLVQLELYSGAADEGDLLDRAEFYFCIEG